MAAPASDPRATSSTFNIAEANLGSNILGERATNVVADIALGAKFCPAAFKVRNGRQIGADVPQQSGQAEISTVLLAQHRQLQASLRVVAGHQRSMADHLQAFMTSSLSDVGDTCQMLFQES